MNPRPCSPTHARDRARSIIGNGGQYALGTGNYQPNGPDAPWTERDDHLVGCDCAGLIVWAFKIPRHRPGYNRGGKFGVDDDLNCNSMLGDAMGAEDLFTLATGAPRPGDVLAYPSFYLYDSYGRPIVHYGKPLRWTGHTGLVVGVSRVSNWDPARPRYEQLDMAQCCGPDGRAPGVIASDGSIWSHHDQRWPKPEHRSWLIRAQA